MANRARDAAENVERKIVCLSVKVFDIVSKDKKVKHVPGDVPEICMDKEVEGRGE